MKKYESKIEYVAVFEKDDDGGYTVWFPDFPGCITEGDTYTEATQFAKEALELHLYALEKDNEKFPAPTAPEDIGTAGDFLGNIQANMTLARMEMENQKVSKNVKIPKWLEALGSEKKINFSKTLECALREELGVGKME